MNIHLNSDADEFALMQLAGLSHVRSTIQLLSAYANAHAPEDEDFECIIAKQRLAACYTYNPTLLAVKIKCNTQFLDCSGFQTPDAPGYVTILLLRSYKLATQRKGRSKPNVKSLIRDWLNLNLPTPSHLDIPLSCISPFFLTHPEQVTYQIKRELSTPIKIKRFKTKWQITRR
jgi:hypothetical protein